MMVNQTTIRSKDIKMLGQLTDLAVHPNGSTVFIDSFRIIYIVEQSGRLADRLTSIQTGKESTMINVAVAGLTLLITDTQRRELLHLDLNGHLLRTERVRLPPFTASKLHDGTIYCSWTQTPHFVYYTSPDHLEVVELTEFSTPFNFSVNTPAGFYIVRGQTADIYRLRNMRILENMSSVALQLTQSKKSRKSSQDAPEKNAEITYNLAVVDIDYCSDKNIIALLHGNEGGQFPFLWTFNTITGETHEVRSGITGGRLFQSLAFSPNGNVRSWRPAPSGFELVELTL